MTNETETSTIRAMRFLSLAASFTLAIIVFCCRGDNSFMLYFDLAGTMNHLIAAYGVGALFCCAAIAIVPYESPRARIAWSITCMLLSLLGTGMALVGDISNAQTTAVICGICLGAGTIGLISQWCCIFAELPARIMPLTIALAFFLGTLLWFILQSANSFVPTCVGLMIFSICGGALLLIAIVASQGQAARSPEDREIFSIEDERTTEDTIRIGNELTTHDESKIESELTLAALEGELETEGELEAEGDPGIDVALPAKPIRVRPALITLDSLSDTSSSRVSRAHVFEMIGAVLIGFFFLGVLYWPDAIEVVQTRAMLKPIAYALASVVTFLLTAHGTVASLASGGLPRIRRVVLIGAALLLLMGILMLPHAEGIPREIIRAIDNFALAITLLFGLITSFTHILRHEPSPSFACAILVVCSGIGLALGLLAFFLFDEGSYFIAACVTGVYLMGLVILTAREKN